MQRKDQKVKEENQKIMSTLDPELQMKLQVFILLNLFILDEKRKERT